MTEELAKFFGGLGSVAHVAVDAQRQLDRELAPNFSATKLLQPKEILLSDVVACLLDPAEVRGQGKPFPRCICGHVQNSALFATSTSSYRVAREQAHLDIFS